MDASIFALLAQDGDHQRCHLCAAGTWRWCWCSPSPASFSFPRVSSSPGARSPWRRWRPASFPGTVWLLLGAGGLTFAADMIDRQPAGAQASSASSLLWHNLAYPLAMAGAALVPASGRRCRMLVKAVPCPWLIVVPMGPMIYRVAFQPVAEAPVLILLIISVALHLLMVGLGLIIFGPEGSRTSPFSEAQLDVGWADDRRPHAGRAVRLAVALDCRLVPVFQPHPGRQGLAAQRRSIATVHA